MVFVGPVRLRQIHPAEDDRRAESVSEGQILIHDRCVNDTACRRIRGVAMVFQNMRCTRT